MSRLPALAAPQGAFRLALHPLGVAPIRERGPTQPGSRRGLSGVVAFGRILGSSALVRSALSRLPLSWLVFGAAPEFLPELHPGVLFLEWHRAIIALLELN